MNILKMAVALLFFMTGLVAWSADLAKVNGRVITDRDVTMALSGLNEGQRTNMMKDAGTRRLILGNVIDQEILSQEAEKEKLDQDQEYKDALAAFKKQFLANKLIAKNLGSQFSEGAAKTYYKNHKDRFSTDEVHAMHILVADEKMAGELFKRAKGGEDFQALAEKFSKDPSAKNNRGDLGFFTRDRMVAAFTDAAFGGAEGSIVGPVKTAYGYHIIKIVQKKAGKPLGFDEVELRVKNELRQELIQTYVDKLKRTAKIEIDTKKLEKL